MIHVFSQGVTANFGGEEKHFHRVFFPEAEQDCLGKRVLKKKLEGW